MDYLPVFIANGFYKNKTDFTSQHVVYSYRRKFPKIERYLGEGRLLRLKASILVKMPYPKTTVRNHLDVAVDFDAALFKRVWKDRWHIYKNRPIRDISETFIVARKVVNSHPSRLAAVRSLLNIHDRIIVFYNFDYELEMIRSLATVVPFAEWNGHKHEPIPDTARWVYAVQYAAGAEGWNCISTDAMCFYSATYSYKLYQQAQGRIDRINTPYHTLYYYNLGGKNVMDLAIQKSLKMKKDFNERDFMINSRT
jgi:hypothetical protein